MLLVIEKSACHNYFGELKNKIISLLFLLCYPLIPRKKASAIKCNVRNFGICKTSLIFVKHISHIRKVNRYAQ